MSKPAAIYQDLILQYQFLETTSALVSDEIEPKLNQVMDNVNDLTWLDGGVDLLTYNTFVDTPDNKIAAAINASGKFTVSTWFESDTLRGSNALILGLTNASDDACFAILQSYGTLQAVVKTDQGQLSLSQSSELIDGELDYISLKFENGYAKLYANGVEVDSAGDGTNTITGWPTDYIFDIGGNSLYGKYQFGSYYQISIDAGAQTDAEILHNSTAHVNSRDGAPIVYSNINISQPDLANETGQLDIFTPADMERTPVNVTFDGSGNISVQVEAEVGTRYITNFLSHGAGATVPTNAWEVVTV